MDTIRFTKGNICNAADGKLYATSGAASIAREMGMLVVFEGREILVLPGEAE